MLMENKKSGLCTNWFYCEHDVEYLEIRTLDEAVDSAADWYDDGRSNPSDLKEKLLNGEVLSWEGYDGNGYLSNYTVYHKNIDELIKYLITEKITNGHLPYDLSYTEEIAKEYKKELDMIIPIMKF